MAGGWASPASTGYDWVHGLNVYWTHVHTHRMLHHSLATWGMHQLRHHGPVLSSPVRAFPCVAIAFSLSHNHHHPPTQFLPHLPGFRRRKGRKRIMLLMSDTGGGHRASAQAIMAGFNKLYGDKFELDMVDLWSDHSPWPHNTMPQSYSFLVKYPWLWRLSYTLTQPRFVHKPISVVTGWQVGHRVAMAYDQYDPDLVVSVHPLMQDVPLRVLRARMRNPDQVGRVFLEDFCGWVFLFGCFWLGVVVVCESLYVCHGVYAPHMLLLYTHALHAVYRMLFDHACCLTTHALLLANPMPTHPLHTYNTHTPSPPTHLPYPHTLSPYTAARQFCNSGYRPHHMP